MRPTNPDIRPMKAEKRRSDLNSIFMALDAAGPPGRGALRGPFAGEGARPAYRDPIDGSPSGPDEHPEKRRGAREVLPPKDDGPVQVVGIAEKLWKGNRRREGRFRPSVVDEGEWAPAPAGGKELPVPDMGSLKEEEAECLPIQARPHPGWG